MLTRSLVFVASLGLLALSACSPADWQQLRDLGGKVCLEHDGWEACLQKCQRAAESEK